MQDQPKAELLHFAFAILLVSATALAESLPTATLSWPETATVNEVFVVYGSGTVSGLKSSPGVALVYSNSITFTALSPKAYFYVIKSNTVFGGIEPVNGVSISYTNPGVEL